jgi:DNA ligase D-like protein (predicted ligase)
MNFIKPMLPTLSNEAPEGSEWCFEIKYDGFRCQLHWDQEEVHLYSRNGNELLFYFPELTKLKKLFSSNFRGDSFILDGELCCLDDNGRPNFDLIQYRGRLKNDTKREIAAKEKPATFLAFDLLYLNEEKLIDITYIERKQKLLSIFSQIEFNSPFFNVIKQAEIFKDVWSKVKSLNHEGVIAKHTSSKWIPGRRTELWKKLKNYKEVKVIVNGYDATNGYFIAGVFNENKIINVGTFIHGLTSEEQLALRTIIDRNSISKLNNTVIMKPKISVILNVIGLQNGTLREPRFVSFQFNVPVEDCTWEQLKMSVLS